MGAGGDRFFLTNRVVRKGCGRLVSPRVLSDYAGCRNFGKVCSSFGDAGVFRVTRSLGGHFKGRS